MADFWLYLSIPLVFGLIGYCTNWLCIKMTLYPIEFVGLGWPLGWQGIIPRRAEEIGRDLVNMLTNRLLNMEEVIDRIDVNQVLEELEPHLLDIIEDIVDDMMMERSPRLWEAVPYQAKSAIYSEVKKQSPAVIAEMVRQIRENINEVFDLEAMLTQSLIEDRRMLVDVFQKIGYAEFRWVINSGGLFGFLLGVVQMLVWMVFPEPVILPLGGILVGSLTNYIALHTIFEPVEPRKWGPYACFGRRHGPWIQQGLFIKRREEMSVDMGVLIAAKVFTGEKLAEAFLQGPASDNLYRLIDRIVKHRLDQITGFAKPFMMMTIGTQRYVSIRDEVGAKIVQTMPSAMKYVYHYTEEAIGVEAMLRDNLRHLNADEYASIIRPIFKADEWKLIALGAVLGSLIGVAQLSLYGN